MASKQSVIELRLKGSEDSYNQLVKLKEQSRAYGEEIKKTRKEIKQFQDEGKNTKQLENKIASLAKAQEKLKKGISDTTKEIRDSNKAFEAAKFPKDSIIGLEQEYSRLRKEIRGLSRDARESSAGKDLIKQARSIKDNIRETNTAFGDTYQNVGNYQQAIENALTGQGSFSGNMKSLALNAAKVAIPLYAATKGVELLGAGLKDAVRITVDYEQANANLASVMGVTIDKTKKLQEQSKELGGDTAFTATEAVKMQEELAKLGYTEEEILKSGRGIVNFTIATNAELPRAAALAGAALRSFQLDASEMDRVVGVLGVSTVKTALNFNDLETGLSTVAPVAHAFGFSIEDTVALLGKLSDAGFDASSAATATRNIILNLADSNGALAKSLGGSVSSFDELIPALNELKNQGIDLNGTLELTDKRSVAAFNQFLNTADSAKVLRDSLYDVNGQLEQMAEERLNTVRGRIELVQSSWESFILSMDKGSGVFSKVTKRALESTSSLLDGLTAMNDGYISFYEFLYNNKPGQREALIKSRKEQKGERDKKSGEYLNALLEGNGVPEILKLSNKDTKETTGNIDELKKKYFDLAKSLGKTPITPKIESDEFYDDEIKKLEQYSQKVKDTKKVLKEPVKGSVDFLEKRISDLKQSLESEVKDDKGLLKAMNELVGYEKQLDILKKKIDETRNKVERGDTVKALDKISTLDLVSGRAFSPPNKEDFELQKRKALDKQILDSQKETIDKAIEYSDDKHEQEIERRKNREQELREFIINSANVISSGISQIETNLSEQKTNRELDAAQKVYDDKIAKAQGNKALEEAAEKELAQKKAAIEKQAAKKRKEIAYKDAIIQGAIATIAAWKEGAWAVALAALTTAINLAVIASTQYAKGGFTGKAKPGMSSDSSGQKPVGIVHEDEYVANKKNTSRFRPFFEGMEKSDDEAMARAAYEQLKNSQTFNRMINNVPPVWSQIAYKSHVNINNSGIENRLDKMTEVMDGMLKGFKSEVIEAVIIGLSESRLPERKGHKR